jgi:uncharacterized membrane protein YdbT with pleckstrin-like domain
MAYLDRVLQPGEKLLMRTRLHWYGYITPMFGLIVALAVVIATFVVLPKSQTAWAGYGLAALIAIAAVLSLIGRMIRVATTEFGVTDHRVIVKHGVFSLHTVEMNVDKIESVDVDQSLMGRMFDFGVVTIHGVGARWDPISGITDPLGFRNAITTRAPQAAVS